MSYFKNYEEYVQGEAESFVEEYASEAFKEINSKNTNMKLFIYGYRAHEWVDNDFIDVDLADCGYILDQSDNVETDFGLWEGKEPREALKSQAFFTYRRDLELQISHVLSNRIEQEIDRTEMNIEEFKEELEELKEHDIDGETSDRQMKIEALIDELDDYLSSLNEARDTL